MVISLQIIQYVGVLLGFLAPGIFHHSWLLRHLPSCLFECWLDNSDPAAFLPAFFLLPSSSGWLVSPDRGNEDCLIIASASSWISSKPEPVWFVWTQAGNSQLSPLWLHLAPPGSLHPPVLCVVSFSPTNVMFADTLTDVGLLQNVH